MRHTALRLSRAGGGPADLMASYDNMQRTGTTGLDRPWRWLAAVNRRAWEVGDLELVAETALVVNFWDTQFRGKLGMGDVSDMMLDCPPDDVTTEVYSVVVQALPAADPNQRVVGNVTGEVTMLGLLKMCAMLVVERSGKVSPEIRSAAERVLAGR